MLILKEKPKASYMTAQDYLTESEQEFRAFQRDYESFRKEVIEELAKIFLSSMKTSRSYHAQDGQLQIKVTLGIDMDIPKQYGQELNERLEEKGAILGDQIEDLDRNLQLYYDQGIDKELLEKLVSHLNEWIDYTPNMGFEAFGAEITFGISASMIEIKEKWDKLLATANEKKEVEQKAEPSVEPDEDTKYRHAQSLRLLAKTSAEMKEAESLFRSLGGYLDSAGMAKFCATAALGLKAKEDNRARLLREEQAAVERRKEALILDKAKRRKMAVEAYKVQVEEIKKAREVFISAEKERLAKNIKNTLAALQSRYDRESKKSKRAIETATAEKSKLEQELEATGLFAFSAKKQLRAQIIDATEKLRLLSIERQEMDAKYEEEKAKQQKAYETALQAVPANAEIKYEMPVDPRTL